MPVIFVPDTDSAIQHCSRPEQTKKQNSRDVGIENEEVNNKGKKK